MVIRYPSVAIVIVNYNGFEYTRECIDSVLKLDYDNYTVVFVDNGSSDGSGESLYNLYKDVVVCLPLTKNHGVTGGNNAGINYALEHQYDYVLFLNNDTIVDRRFLGAMVKTSQESNNALVVPKIICYYDPKRLDHWVGVDYNWWTGQPKGYSAYPLDTPALNAHSEIKVASTCCLLTPVSVIRQIGVMDENYFMYNDDADFTLRATRAGYRMFYEPTAIIYHKCNMTTKNKQPAYFEYYLIYRNFFYFYNKLCTNLFVKYVFFVRLGTLLILQYFKSYVNRNPSKRQVINLIVRDILVRRMGPVPAEQPFVSAI
mgnify:CR=1 FL=1